MQAESVTIEIPHEIMKYIRREMSRKEKQSLRLDREPFHSAEAQLLLEEAIVKWYAEQKGLNPEQADYQLSGEIVTKRDENGRFSQD